MKILAFLLETFGDKKGGTRAAATGTGVLVICLYFFAQKSEVATLREQVDSQNKLLWANVNQIDNTLATKGIYVPRVTPGVADQSTNNFKATRK